MSRLAHVMTRSKSCLRCWQFLSTNVTLPWCMAFTVCHQLTKCKCMQLMFWTSLSEVLQISKCIPLELIFSMNHLKMCIAFTKDGILLQYMQDSLHLTSLEQTHFPAVTIPRNLVMLFWVSAKLLTSLVLVSPDRWASSGIGAGLFPDLVDASEALSVLELDSANSVSVKLYQAPASKAAVSLFLDDSQHGALWWIA